MLQPLGGAPKPGHRDLRREPHQPAAHQPVRRSADHPTRRRTARDRRWRGVAQRFLQREDFRLFASGTGLLMAEGHDDDRGNGLLLRDEIVHDGVGHAGLRPAALVVVGAVQQVHDRIVLVAGVVVGRRVDDHSAGDLVHLVEVVVLDQVAVRHVAEHHEVRFLARQGDDALVDAGRRTNEGVLRIGRRESVHDEPVLVVARRELRGRERPDAIGVFGHVETGGAVDRGVAELGHVGNTRTFLALGACSRKVMVLSAFTSGERALVTTLASTPGPRPRPVGPLPPGGLLLIWAWTEVATSVASAVAGRTRRIRFMVSS